MEKSFELKSVKIYPFGLECKYCIIEFDESGTEIETQHSVKDCRLIHSDLREIFDMALPIEAEAIIGIDANEMMVGLEVTGVSFSGKGENIGVCLNGIILGKFGPVKFKTPRIKYKVSDTDVAVNLTHWAESLTKEVYAYLFEEKTAEVKIFGEE